MNAFDRLKLTHFQARAGWLQRQAEIQKKRDRQSDFVGAYQRYDASTGLHLVILPDGSEVWAEAINNAGFVAGQVVSVTRYKGQRKGVLRGSPTT